MANNYPNVQLREYLETDYEHFVQNLREEDKKELVALFDDPYEEGLKYSIEQTDDLWVATEFGIPFLIFGMSNRTEEGDNEKSALVWAVGTERSKKLGRAICGISKKVLRSWLEEYDVLFNYIWEEATDHMKWLKSMGFIIFEEEYIIAPSEEKFIFFAQFSEPTEE